MKTPRVTDFDPNATPPPSLGSPMENMPRIQKPSKPSPLPAAAFHKPQAAPPPGVLQKQNEPVPTSVRTGVRRVITRYAYEFYQDQIETLRDFSLTEKSHGEQGSMSQMVRDAIDLYIKKRREHGK